MASQKVTRALAQRLAKSKGAAVSGAVFVAIDSDKLPLSSFAARAAARDKEVREKITQVMQLIHEWEQANGTRVALEVRPERPAVVVTAPAALFEALSEDAAVAALDVPDVDAA
jgi:hypothetical protein